MKDTFTHEPSLPSAWLRVLHHLRTDWRRQRLWGAGFLAWVLFRMVYRLDPWWSQPGGRLWVEPGWMQNIAFGLAIALTIRVILADTPANTELTVHSRPLGRGVLLAAKVLFLGLAVVLPWLLADAVLWYGFGHSPATLAGLAAGSFFDISPHVLIGAALASLAAGGTQLTLLGFGAALLTMALALLTASTSSPWPNQDTPPNPGWLGAFLACLPVLLTALLAAAVWFLQGLARRRRAGLILAVASALVMGCYPLWQKMPWKHAHDLRYQDASLTLLVGTQPAATAPGAPLLSFWPGLHLAGLPAGHMATVVRLGPAGMSEAQIDFGRTRGTGPPCWSDHIMGENPWVKDVALERTLADLHAPGDLWLDNLQDQDRRKDLSNVLGGAADRPWRLQVAVHAPRKILDVSLRGLTDGSPPVPRILLPHGGRMDFDPMQDCGKSYRLTWQWRHQRPSYAPGPPAIHRGMEPLRQNATGLIGVLHDPDARENTLVWVNGIITTDRSGTWIMDSSLKREMSFNKPLDRMQLTGLKLDDWLDRVHLEIWLVEERGSVEFQLTPKELAEAMKP